MPDWKQDCECDICMHSVRCQWLLGNSYRKHGPCDWTPSRFVLGAARICPACGFKYGHNVGCEYVQEKLKEFAEQADKLHEGSMDNIAQR